jgi:hypothetical protein|tara:strand:- start:669 stop:893 length:225 start_codon:yes stop_codon:yes gene_type:complete
MDGMEEEERFIMFPPDILVQRMEQVRLLAEDMKKPDFDKTTYMLLTRAVNILLDSCELPSKNISSLSDNIHPFN